MAGVSAVTAALLALASGGPARSGPNVAAGDPARGATVWVSAGCGACHAFAKAGSTGQKTGDAPNLDRWLAADAARSKLSVADFVYRRVYWGGRGMTAYGNSLDAQDLEDLVSFVSGTSFSAPAGTPPLVAALPVPPALVTANARTVAKWKKAARLPKKALPGAAVFAQAGCLSCHTYLGSGTRSRGAPDLSREAAKRRSAAWLRRYVARPTAFGNTLMPAYADLGAAKLRSLAAFLAASHG